jgi:hypothetical protein
MNKIEDFDIKDWDELDGCVYSVLKKWSTYDELFDLFRSLPDYIQEEAFNYGMEDIEFQETVTLYLEENKQRYSPR